MFLHTFPLGLELELEPSADVSMSWVVGLDSHGEPVDLYPEGLFKLQVYDEEGKVCMLQKGLYNPLDEMHVQHKVGECSVKPDAVSSWSMDVAVFKCGKDCCSLCVWSFVKLYAMLGFKDQKLY